MKRQSAKRFSYQSERFTFGRGSFGFPSKIGLALNGTENLIFDRKIRIEIDFHTLRTMMFCISEPSGSGHLP